MKVVDVVAAVLTNAKGDVLMAQRPRGKSLEGLWEFPGGKVEEGESHHVALVRELDEELGLSLSADPAASQFLHCTHINQAERSLRLHFYRCLNIDLSSVAKVGLDGQALRLVPPARLHRLPMPPADIEFAFQLGLPRQYVISSEPEQNPDWLDRIQQSLQRGQRLFLLRSKAQSLSDLRALATKARDRIAAFGGDLLVQDDADLAIQWRMGGLSLTSAKLMRCKARPVPQTMYFAASCHDAKELEHAQRIGCDFVTLAPIQATATHPDAAPMGLTKLAEHCREFPNLRIFALGGMGLVNAAEVTAAGAWGSAGITGYF